MALKKQHNSERDADSYVHYDYFPIDISDIIINTSIDRIVLSSTQSIDNLHRELVKHFKVKSEYNLKKGNFKRKRIYINSSSNIDLLYKPIEKPFFVTKFLLTLYQPGKDIISLFNHVFNKLFIQTKIKTIEFAWDFYGCNVWLLQEFLERHLFLKYQRKPSRRYKNTYYTNDIRKSSKGVRLYPRPKESEYKDYVRLELVLQRSIIKRMHLTFPIRSSYLDIDFRRYFEFRKFDFDKYYNYERKKSRGKISVCARPGYGEAVLRHIESWLHTQANRPLMKSIEHLKSKKLPNYARFFVPYGELNMLLEEAVATQRFQLMELSTD